MRQYSVFDTFSDVLLIFIDVCAAAKSIPFAFSFPGSIQMVTYVNDAQVTTAPNLISMEIGGTLVDGSEWSIDTGVPAQTAKVLPCSANNEFSMGDIITISSDGSGSGTVNVTAAIVVEKKK